MFIKFRKKGQSTAEYVIVLGLAVAAVMAMQTYVKRGLQGRIKEAVDYVDAGSANGGAAFTGGQYEPYYLESHSESARRATDIEENLKAGAVVRTSNENTYREGYQTMQKGRADND